ncbi:MAG: ABC transporter substrate-binding protein [Blautia sp.]|jgi:ABC-type glycerol-3-phosphate transport system substrate-binding protein
MNKKIWGMGMALLLAVSAVLSGCGGSKGEGEDTGSAAMGRYLEEEIALPQDDLSGIKDITMLEDGTLRMAGADQEQKLHIWDYQDGAWVENTKLGEALPQIEDKNTQFIDQVALDTSGKAAVSMSNMEEGNGKLFVLEADGTVRDLSDTVKQDASYPQLLNMEFTGDGTLVAQGFYDLLAMYDGTTGETIQNFEIDGVVTFSVVGDRIVVIGDHQVQLYDAKSGSPLDKDEVLNDQISDDKNNLELLNTSSKPVVFTKGEEDGIFYCSREGIFSHHFGGNTVEKVVDGKLCSISSAYVGFQRLLKGNDNDFFLLAMDDVKSKIYHYTYSKDTPTVPGTTLKLYSLLEDDTVSQVIPMFQKMYPDIYVDYQVGLSGEDGMTVSDALKNLNTEVMAGKGPDVFLLDNMPVDSYAEKGLLMDISDVIKEVADTDGILENITKSYENDGKIYVMPSHIGLPVMMGKEEDLDGIEDLKTMADAGERLQAENPDDYAFGPYKWAYSLVGEWTDNCSPAWTKEDGSVDEEALSEFYTQLKRIFKTVKNPQAKNYSDEDMLADYDSMAHYYTSIGSDLLMQYGGFCRLAYGTLSSLDGYSQACAVMREKGSVIETWNGQAENCFVPNLMLGISSKCKEEDAAKKFVSYFLSKDAQAVTSYAGFPVNRAVLEGGSYWNYEGVSSSGTTMEIDGKTIDIILTTVEFKQEEIDWMVEHLSSAVTPAPYNYLIVDAVRSQAIAYLNDKVSLEEAVSAVSQKMNLYLTE